MASEASKTTVEQISDQLLNDLQYADKVRRGEVGVTIPGGESREEWGNRLEAKAHTKHCMALQELQGSEKQTTDLTGLHMSDETGYDPSVG